MATLRAGLRERGKGLQLKIPSARLLGSVLASDWFYPFRNLPAWETKVVRLLTAVKSKEAQVGDVVDFVLDHDLYQGDLLLAREASVAQAVVVEASKAKWGSRRGKLAIEIRGVRMVNGQTLPLRGTPTVFRYSGQVCFASPSDQ